MIVFPTLSLGLLLSIILINSTSITARNLKRSTVNFFNAELERDQIIYTSIVIPRYANEVVIKMFATTKDDLSKFTRNSAANITVADPVSDNSTLPFVLLKYNGLPSLGNYDAIFQLMRSPLSLQITDSLPRESELFIGFWGGYQLHSFRYFAGSPSVFLVGMKYSLAFIVVTVLALCYCKKIKHSEYALLSRCGVNLVNFVHLPSSRKSASTVVDIFVVVLTHADILRQYMTNHDLQFITHCRHRVDCILLQKPAAQGA